jgi:hypothetical protein
VTHKGTPLARAAYWCTPALICLLVHWRGFTAWFQSDDFVWLGILHGHGFHDFLNALFVPGSAGHLRPWSERLIFMTSYGLFGLNPLPFRLIVFAIEFANLALIASIGTRLTGRRAAGFFAAVLWGISATSVDPLAWAAANNQVQVAFFLLLAFHFLLRYVETGDGRYNLYQWIAFLLGFGALEVNIVYPALTAAYTFLLARRYFWKTLPMFLASAAYLSLHAAVAPTGKDPAYVLHYTGAMFRTLAKYWAWTAGPVGFWAPMPVPSWLIPAAVAVLSIGLWIFAAMRGRLALFFLAWFVISITPVLPLRDHIEEYYAFVPAIGLCWLGGWAIAECWRANALPRAAAVGLATIYALIVVPRTLAGSDYHYRFSERVRNLVEGVERAHELHPDQTILLDGVDTPLFYNGVLDRPFRLVGVDHVYLTPESERQIEAHPEMAEVGEFVLPSDQVAKALENGEVAVYDVRGTLLRNITSAYASQPRGLGLPHRVDVGNPLAARLLGPEWYAAEENHRWMPKRASLQIAGPSATGQKLYLHGYYPPEQLRAGPLTVAVTVNGSALAPAMLASGGNFELAYALPDTLVGQPTMQVAVEVSRTFHTGADIRDLGLAFGDLEVR